MQHAAACGQDAVLQADSCRILAQPAWPPTSFSNSRSRRLQGGLPERAARVLACELAAYAMHTAAVGHVCMHGRRAKCRATRLFKGCLSSGCGVLCSMVDWPKTIDERALVAVRNLVCCGLGAYRHSVCGWVGLLGAARYSVRQRQAWVCLQDAAVCACMRAWMTRLCCCHGGFVSQQIRVPREHSTAHGAGYAVDSMTLLAAATCAVAALAPTCGSWV